MFLKLFTHPINYWYSCINIVNINMNDVFNIQMYLYRNKDYRSNVYKIILETNQNANHK